MSSNMLIREDTTESNDVNGNIDVEFISFVEDIDATTLDHHSSLQSCFDRNFSQNQNGSSFDFIMQKQQQASRKRACSQNEDSKTEVKKKKPFVSNDNKHINTYLLDVFDKHTYNTLSEKAILERNTSGFELLGSNQTVSTVSTLTNTSNDQDNEMSCCSVDITEDDWKSIYFDLDGECETASTHINQVYEEMEKSVAKENKLFVQLDSLNDMLGKYMLDVHRKVDLPANSEFIDLVKLVDCKQKEMFVYYMAQLNIFSFRGVFAMLFAILAMKDLKS